MDSHSLSWNSVKPEKIFKKADIVEFCGSCHNDELKDYQLSKHSEIVNKGIRNSPNCSTCHGKHRLKSKKELEEGCLVCHENKSEENIFKTTSRISEDNLKLYQPHSLKE